MKLIIWAIAAGTVAATLITALFPMLPFWPWMAVTSVGVFIWLMQVC